MQKHVPRDTLALVARCLMEPETVRVDFRHGAPAAEKDPVVLGTVEDQPSTPPRCRHVVLLGPEREVVLTSRESSMAYGAGTLHHQAV